MEGTTLDFAYERMIHGILIFPSSEVLLLSERESNGAYSSLSELIDRGKRVAVIYVDNRQAVTTPRNTPMALFSGINPVWASTDCLAAMQLWNGETKFEERHHQSVNGIINHKNHGPCQVSGKECNL